MNDPYQIKDATRRGAPSPIVNALRQEVFDWRQGGYPGASETSKTLLSYWFDEEHKNFNYFFAQREAIETLIYLYEVAKLKTFFDLWRRFDTKQLIDPRLAKEDWPRYVFKMATGSGKTKVMSLAIVWSYFHKLKEPNSPLSKNFVLIAPNIIVFERLKSDFYEGKIFRDDPLIPPSWQSDWNVRVLLQDEFSTANPDGNIYLTNIHRLFNREEKAAPNPAAVLIGAAPKGEIETSNRELIHQVFSHKDLVVVNDEAHHLHEEDLAWAKTIASLHDELKKKGSEGLTAQLDFTATPRGETGATFPQVIVDYPLVEAIEDGIVKRPILPDDKSTKDFIENPVDNVALRFKPWIDLGVSRWKKYRDTFAKTGKKPVLFVMTDDTAGAAEVQAYLEEKYKDELGGKILEIHTKVNRNGEISEADSNEEYLQKLRQAVTQIDSDQNPYHAVVSVVMLREGWDVQNVTVIVGLRPFTAKRNILPEQAIGRGLRRMRRDNPNFKETVDIIGSKAFEEFVRQLEAEEVTFEREDMTEPPPFKAIYVEEAKVPKFDIEIPLLTPILSRESKNIEGLTLDDIAKKFVKRKSYSPEEIKNIVFIDAITKEVEDEHKLKLEHPRNPESVISFFTTVIAKSTKVTGQFATLYPLVEGYTQNVLFGGKVDLSDRAVLKQLSEAEPQQVLYTVFSDAINKATLVEKKAKPSGEVLKISKTNGFEWSRETYEGEKQVFNLVPCESHFEATFAEFLGGADDVLAYAKNNRSVHFFIEYLGIKGNLRYYYPDFIVRTKAGYFIVETKGREDLEVAQKDARAEKWCKDVSKVTGDKWGYLKVGQEDFEGYRHMSFEDLVRFYAK